jgi:protein TonB
MFTNLIESDSHRKEFKRRSSFMLATVAAYALILSGAGVGSIYAYDAHLEAQNTDLTLLAWVPEIKPVVERERPRETQPPRKSTPTNAPVDKNVTVSIRTEAIALTNDPTKVPDDIGTKASLVPPVNGSFKIGPKNVDPPSFVPSDSGCATCSPTTPPRVEETTPPPVPVVVKPTTQKVSMGVLMSRVVNLPQPPYPQLAKQIRIQGPVNVQILVDEQGRVVSAQALSGHPALTGEARDAAMRARFTPTMLSGQAVKVQGVITYNFVLQ